MAALQWNKYQIYKHNPLSTNFPIMLLLQCHFDQTNRLTAKLALSYLSLHYTFPRVYFSAGGVLDKQDIRGASRVCGIAWLWVCVWRLCSVMISSGQYLKYFWAYHVKIFRIFRNFFGFILFAVWVPKRSICATRVSVSKKYNLHGAQFINNIFIILALTYTCMCA